MSDLGKIYDELGELKESKATRDEQMRNIEKKLDDIIDMQKSQDDRLSNIETTITKGKFGLRVLAWVGAGAMAVLGIFTDIFSSIIFTFKG